VAARLLGFVPLGRFVAFTSLAWAVMLFCTAGAFNFKGMMAARFFLGMAEAGISPAYVLITGTWYKKDEIPVRITLWYCGNGFAIILQAFIAYGIGHINYTGIAVWRWFFIIFGVLGLAWAVVLYFYMPDTPITAKFLNEREKTIAVERLRENRTGIANSEFKKEQVYEALLDVKVWYGFFYAIACVVPASAVANFGSIVIKGISVVILP
jgi:ACS family allantoate permease-like MFS transporter